jgi:hypothetical protein
MMTIRGTPASERQPPQLEFSLHNQQGKRYLTRH